MTLTSARPKRDRRRPGSWADGSAFSISGVREGGGVHTVRIAHGVKRSVSFALAEVVES
jgi:hypothetical protein